MAVVAAREALAQSGAFDAPVDPDRIGVYFGSCLGGARASVSEAGLSLDAPAGSQQHLMQSLADVVAVALRSSGPRVVVNTACAAGAHAVGLAADALLSGAVDVAIAGGADELSPLAVAGFAAVGALDPNPCAPYARSSGLSLGEGGAFLVLERPERAIARGATVRATVLGYGLSADAYHPTAPDPDGRGPELAIRRALEAAGLDLDEVDYVNGHGTGTPTNDAMELGLFERLWSQTGRRMPVASTKAATGHAFAGSAAMELALCALAVERDVMPPTSGADAGTGLEAVDIVGPTGRAASTHVALSTSYAFGGTNAAVVLGGPDSTGRATPAPRRTVISGVGAIGAAGIGRSAWWDALAAGTSLVERRAVSLDGQDVSCWLSEGPPPPAGDFATRRQWRRMDGFARACTTAAFLAMEDAGATDLIGDEGVGVFVATESGPLDTAMEFEAGVRSANRVNPALFSNAVMTSTAGHVSRTFGWKGPTTTLMTGWTSAAHAVLHAHDMLERGIARAIVVVAGDVVCPEALETLRNLGLLATAVAPRPFDPTSAGVGLAATAVAVVLQREEDARRHGHGCVAHVRGGAGLGDARLHWGLPTDHEVWRRCHQAALARCGVRTDEIDLVVAAAAGVPAADDAERTAILGTFEGRVRVSAPKSVVGEAKGADALVGLVTAIAAMDRGAVPAAICLDPDGAGPTADSAPAPTGPPALTSQATVRRALVNASSVGGNLATILVEAS